MAMAKKNTTAGTRKFEFELTKRIELVRIVTIEAADEDEAERKVQKLIADGLDREIEWKAPAEWTDSNDVTDYQLR